MTALVLATYGTACHLKLPGCTRLATTKDHLIPYSHGGGNILENYRPACKTCNSRRGNRVISGYGARIVVVIGPPAAGKTTYVREHAAANDVSIDLDLIARALMPEPPEATHTYPQHVREIAMAARAAAIERATHRAYGCTVWLIHAIPHPNALAQYKALHYEVVTIDPGRDVVEERAAVMRPAIMRTAIAKWYEQQQVGQHAEAEPVEVQREREPVAAGEWRPEW